MAAIAEDAAAIGEILYASIPYNRHAIEDGYISAVIYSRHGCYRRMAAIEDGCYSRHG